ncbi:MAG: chromosome segregation and condensation protein ScpB [Candidatus Saccharibacteria bacterium]|nr:chromosome segregation and condensation protein ScpB [Candidatus Saccharibacteria bacterium]
MPKLDLAQRLQAVLFVAPNPATVEQLATATETTAKEVKAALGELSKSLGSTGMRLTELDGQYRLVTAPEAADDVRRFLQEEANSDN